MFRMIYGLAVFDCDTPNCKARCETKRKKFSSAAAKARREGWAIGIGADACPAHHVQRKQPQ